MSSVGPQLPPHLSKRKRSIDDDDTPNSPPHKLIAAEEPQRLVGPSPPPPANEEEIALSSDEEDSYGPSIRPNASSKPEKRVLGPAPPTTTNEQEIALSSDEDEYGPSVPSAPPKPTPAPKRILGPAPPPASLAECPSEPANPEDESSDDDDYGPSLPPAPGSAAETRMLQQRQAEESRTASSTNSTRPQRDDWMLVPPSDSDWTSRVDPTKLKNRKFASGKGAKAPAEKSGISAIWTETPEEKRRRLEDEVLGRKDAATSSRGNASSAGPVVGDKEDEATARRIREYNERNRNRSLYEEHKGQTQKEKEDDPSKRGFDKEKDMGLGGRIGHVQKKDMLGRMADFGSKFQKGRYL